MTHPAPGREWLRARTVAAVTLGVALTLAAWLPATLHGGWLLLLDWSTGPRQAFLPASAYGPAGGIVGGLPLGIAVAGLVHLLGAAGSWVVPAAVIPVAAWSASRLTTGEVR